MKITFDPAGLSSVRQAKQSVSMARQVETQVGPFGNGAKLASGNDRSAGCDVAWQVFFPVEINNIFWNDVYFAFASLMLPKLGKLIPTNSSLRLALGAGCVYKDGQISEATACDADKISIGNKSQDSPLCFGLAQRAEVNGKPRLFPICNVAILRGETAIFKPHAGTKLFLSSEIKSGTLISRLGPLEEFIPGSDVVYDAKTASFRHRAP
ncbi:MAG: hypothetical protein ACRYGP_07690 [Janthinobacterium lividum]